MRRLWFFVLMFILFSVSLYCSEYYLKKYKDIYLLYSKNIKFDRSDMYRFLNSVAVMILENDNLKVSAVSIVYKSDLGRDLYKRVISSNDIFKSGREYVERPRYEVRIILKRYLTNLKKYVNGFQIFLYDRFKKEYKLIDISEDDLCSVLNYRLLNFDRDNMNYKFECLGRSYKYFSKDYILLR